MRVAVVGSRGLNIDNIGSYLPKETTRIISGGAKGIDTCAAEYAKENGLELFEIRPDYSRYKKAAPLVRNKEIVSISDCVIAFWDGKSRGTKFVIDECERINRKIKIFMCK